MRERLAKESESKFQDALNQSATELQASLGSTAAQLDQLLKQLGAEIVGNELERYRVDLGQLRKQAQADIGTVRTEVEAHKAELESQLQQEIGAEKQRLIQQIDTKIADAVSSFLLETLQHNIDLGAQEAYLHSMLEEHKADFIQEVADESHPTK
jgi:F0F1-type ATP synthase membrane subunit b/b'